jgi:putative endonuclease
LKKNALRLGASASRDRQAAHFVYIVRCADDTLYTGYTRHPERRVAVHNAGHGAKYTAGRRPVTLVYWELWRSRTAALKREYQVKQLTRAEKELLLGRN